MPDISMCRNKICILKSNCYRAIAEPGYKQSYNRFKPNEDGNCLNFVHLVRHVNINETNKAAKERPARATRKKFFN